MKSAAAICLVALVAFSAVSMNVAARATPIEKVLQMIGDLETKILKEGTDAQKTYDEFSEFCEDRSRQLQFEIKTGKAEVKELEAAIANEKATIESLDAQIEELAS